MPRGAGRVRGVRPGGAAARAEREEERQRKRKNHGCGERDNPDGAAASGGDVHVVVQSELVELVAGVGDAHGVVRALVAGGDVAAEQVGVDAHDRAVGVDERAAGVAVVNLRVVLDEPRVEGRGVGEAGDDAACDGDVLGVGQQGLGIRPALREVGAARIAQGVHVLAHDDLVRGGEERQGHAALGRLLRADYGVVRPVAGGGVEHRAGD